MEETPKKRFNWVGLIIKVAQVVIAVLTGAGIGSQL